LYHSGGLKARLICHKKADYQKCCYLRLDSRTAEIISLVVAFVLMPFMQRGDRDSWRTGEIENICPSFLFILTAPSRLAISRTLENFCLACE
jgi:hypothetical protein